MDHGSSHAGRQPLQRLQFPVAVAVAVALAVIALFVLTPHVRLRSVQVLCGGRLNPVDRELHLALLAARILYMEGLVQGVQQRPSMCLSPVAPSDARAPPVARGKQAALGVDQGVAGGMLVAGPVLRNLVVLQTVSPEAKADDARRRSC